jgi:hypothetical protein
MKIGMMEYWNTGILECWVNLLSVVFVLPIIPLLHYSNFPSVSVFPIIPFFHNSIIP